MKCDSYSIDTEKKMYPGQVSQDHFKIMIALSNVRGKKAIVSLEAYLVKGWLRKDIFEFYKISPGYFSQKLNQVRRCNEMIVEVLPFYMG